MTDTCMMVDIETLGTRYDAPIVSIGACFFDPMTGDIGNTFYDRVSIFDAMAFGSADPKTLIWWLKQSEEARNELAGGGFALSYVLADFEDFYLTNPDAPVFANGPTFDISILDYAYQACLNQAPPWKFWNVRDVRTVVHMAHGIVAKPPFDHDKVKHHALNDAIYQAGFVSDMWQKLRGHGCDVDVA